MSAKKGKRERGRGRERTPPDDPAPRGAADRAEPRATPLARRLPSWALVLALAAVFGLGFLARKRSCSPNTLEPPPSVADSGPPPEGEAIGVERAYQLFQLAQTVLREPAPPANPAVRGRLVVVTFEQKKGANIVVTGEGAALEDAVRDAANRASTAGGGRPVRLDVAEEIEAATPVGPETRFELGNDLGLVGYYLPERSAWLLPDELIAHGLYEGAGVVRAQLLGAYVAAARGNERALPLTRVHAVRYGSFLARGDRAVPLYRGNPPRERPGADALLEASVLAGDYLLRHQKPDGSFNYVVKGTTGAPGTTYNVLRHAGTAYALYELSRATGRAPYREAADKAMRWLIERHGRTRGYADDGLAIVENDEAKLGGAALALLAIVEAHRGGSYGETLPTAHDLARYLLSQQEPSGRFVSKTTWSTGDVDDFESLYYPGEAIFALAQLHIEDGDERWLSASERAASYLITVRDRDVPDDKLEHDHWLLMGLEQLQAKRPKDLYLQHGVRIGDAIVRAMQQGPYLDWDGSFYDPPRSTPASTRVEGLVALVRMLERAGRPAEKYRAALARIVSFQKSCQITEENSLFLPNPAPLWGGFRESLTSYDVRIDFVQHAISGMLGYRGLLGG